MSERAEFYEKNVRPMELLLLGHDVASYFRGNLFVYAAGQPEGVPLLELALPDFCEGPVRLSPVDVGRLFFAPDESLVDFRNIGEGGDGSPAGFAVLSDSPFIQEGYPTEVIAYRQDANHTLVMKNLHLRTILLAPDAPDKFACIRPHGHYGVSLWVFDNHAICRGQRTNTP